MNIGVEYIKYRWDCWLQPKTIDPDLVELIATVQTKNIDSQDHRAINQLFASLKNNDSFISVQDFGAGSKKLNTQRKISSIFATSSSKGRYGKLLYQISKHYRPENTLELGTSIGIGSTFMKMGFPNGTVTTIEACPNTFEVAKANFEKLGIGINQINSTFLDFFQRNKQVTYKYDLVFIDGHHDGVAVLNYLDLLKELLAEHAVIIVDDIRWSDSMKTAWNSIVANPETNCTIDLFRMGIILNKEALNKTHYCLKI